MMVQHHSLGEAWVTSPNICLDVYTRLSQTRHAHVIPNLFQYQWVSSISKSTELEPFKICFSVLCQDISVVCKHWEYNPNQLQTTISQHTVMAMYTELWQVMTKRTELLCLAKITEIESDFFLYSFCHQNLQSGKMTEHQQMLNYCEYKCFILTSPGLLVNSQGE